MTLDKVIESCIIHQRSASSAASSANSATSSFPASSTTPMSLLSQSSFQREATKAANKADEEYEYHRSISGMFLLFCVVFERQLTAMDDIEFVSGKVLQLTDIQTLALLLKKELYRLYINESSSFVLNKYQSTGGNMDSTTTTRSSLLSSTSSSSSSKHLLYRQQYQVIF